MHIIICTRIISKGRFSQVRADCELGETQVWLSWLALSQIEVAPPLVSFRSFRVLGVVKSVNMFMDRLKTLMGLHEDVTKNIGEVFSKIFYIYVVGPFIIIHNPRVMNFITLVGGS